MGGRGRPSDLRTHLQRRSWFEANYAALRDPKFRLIVTTKEAIDTRTDKWNPASAPTMADP